MSVVLEMIMVKTQLMLQGFIAGLEEFKEENRRENKKLKREVAEVSRKMGTIVEDMVAPNIEYIAKKYFNLITCIDFGIRRKKLNLQDKSGLKEFDVIAVYSDKVIVNETKSNPKPELVGEFIDFIKAGEFFEYFPEYAGKELIPIFASLYIPDNVLKLLSKNKIYAMGVKEDTMDILNFQFL